MNAIRVTIHQAVELLTEQLQPVGSEARATKDRVRKRIVYALMKGTLRHVDGKEGLDRNDLLVWAKKKWPNQIKLGAKHFVGVEERLNVSGTLTADNYPGDLVECHRLLREARRQLLTKGLQCAVLIGQLERERAAAEKYRRICETNRQSAMLPRNGESDN